MNDKQFSFFTKTIFLSFPELPTEMLFSCEECRLYLYDDVADSVGKLGLNHLRGEGS